MRYVSVIKVAAVTGLVWCMIGVKAQTKPVIDFPPAKKGGRNACVNIEEVVNAILGGRSYDSLTHGDATLKFDINKEGVPVNISVVSSTDDLFAQTAVEHIRDLRCSPSLAHRGYRWHLDYFEPEVPKIL